MLFSENVTFIIPIFRLKSDRINNLKFIIPYILNTECKVLIVEQSNDKLSDLGEVIPVHENIKHLLYTSNSDIFHKSGIINWAVKNHVNTKYAWVNDVDFYMKFDKVLSEDWNSDFIKPYISGKKLSADDTKKIIDGEKLNVSYEDEAAEYISLYGALSFIFEKNAFLNIGGMDETIFGWGEEDVELNTRIQNLKIDVQEIDFKGIHLHHEITAIQHFGKNADIQQTSNALKKSDLAIITCYFNWCGFTTPSRNFHRFLREMKKNNFPVFGVELSLTDNFETTGMCGWSQLKVKKENMCFQKEACLNLVEKKVPVQYTKIAWIDCDLTFSNTNWYHQASKKLERNKLIQLYTHGYNTDRYGRTVFEFPGLMYMKDKLPHKDWIKHAGFPGGAWAARRELWKYGGLYPYAVMGGGDTVFIYSMYDCGFEKSSYENIGINKNAELSIYTNWKKSVASYIKKDISYIENKFLHEWHGDKKNRNYSNRHGILKNIDIKKQIRLNDQGILEFYNLKDGAIFNDIYNYFLERDEDGLLEDLLDFGKKKYIHIT